MKKLSCILCFTLLLLSACSSQSNHNVEEQDFDQAKAAKTRISLGLTYLKNGNYSQAKYNLDKALQFDPRSADAYFALAYYYQQVEEHDAAEKAYQKAMDLEPDNADIANSYGAFLCQRGKYAEAKRYFLKAVNSDNYISSAETYENLALCSQSHGQVEDALQYLRSAVNHQPGRAKSLYLLAQLLAESKYWVEAKDVLRRYEKVSQVSPGSLLLASEIENALGNTQLSTGYGEMLLRMYPSDPATAIYLKQHGKVSSATSPVARKSNKTPVIAPVAEPEMPAKKELVLEVTKATPTTDAVIEEADVAAEESVSAPDEEMPDVVLQDTAAMPPAVETTELTSANNVTTKKLALEDEVAEVIEDSQKEDVIASLAENNQQIEQAEIVVVEESEPLTEQAPTFHIVQKEENLYRISLLYNIKMQRLIEWNNLPDAASIYIGKKLIIVAPETQE